MLMSLDQLHQLTPGFPSGSELLAATMWLIPHRLMRRCPLLGINAKNTRCNWSTSWHRRNSSAVHTTLASTPAATLGCVSYNLTYGSGTKWTA